MRSTPLARAACVASALGCATAAAQDPVRLADLADLSLEQLTKITVTTASRRAESLVEAPASIFVITADDIRRSGALTIPEALRLAPNLHVARADNNQYVVAARGFSDVLTNKLLVLIDGRTVYTPLFSGVFWEAQDTLLTDVDRIEVISGPGATLWGANAVNGVINIITKSAIDTQGTSLRAGAGNYDRIASARLGGPISANGSYRVYAKYRDGDGFDGPAGPIGDSSRMTTGGFRADWRDGRGELTVQADGYHGSVDAGPEREFSGASFIVRQSRRLDSGARLSLQAYYDYTYRRHENSFADRLDTFDVEMQHSSRPMAQHSLVWGGGYRAARDDATNSVAQAFIPEDRNLRWANAFVQDEIALGNGWSTSLGVKVEHNPFTGSEWLPSARLSWMTGADTLAWAALSRAVRAPSRIDREVYFPGTTPYVLVGNQTFESEVANVGELGWRTQATSAISFSATLYYHDYPNLRSVGPGNGALVFRNDIEGNVHGIESWGTWRIDPRWRLTGGFVAQKFDFRVKEGQLDFGGLDLLGNSPERMAQVRSSWSPTGNIDFDATVRYVGKLQRSVPAYTAADLRLAWRPIPSLEVSGVVRNAFDREHVEWQNQGVIPRTYLLVLRWQT